MSVVKYMCEKLAIMHNGRFVEFGDSEAIYDDPTHIYTKRLLSAIPNIDPRKKGKNKELRKALADEYKLNRDLYYQPDGSVYPLRQLTADHWVATP
jgi:peptide/nickel transport system ATP-binding protein